MADASSQLDKALKKMAAEVREGLRHGFFEYHLRCEIAKGRKRELILEAGKKYKFTIPEEEVDSYCEQIGDS